MDRKPQRGGNMYSMSNKTNIAAPLGLSTHDSHELCLLDFFAQYRLFLQPKKQQHQQNSLA